MNRSTNPEAIEVGVVGLGLMGSSIVVSLLMAGHKVKAVAPISADMQQVRGRILGHLEECREARLLDEHPYPYEKNLAITEDYNTLVNCVLVFECVIEDLRIKAAVYNKIAVVVQSDAVIASNTSAIAITTLQSLVPNPERFLGIHWAEPAYATRFMEITCGDKTCMSYAEWVFELAHRWGKEPTLLRKDIRGFITNRLMYAVYREIMHLVEAGRISMEDADKAFRYDAGSWMTFMGVFRRMDYCGLADWATILKNILPTLSNESRVPHVMQQMVDDNARGTQNLKGLYPYSSEEAKEWEEAFAVFNKEIFRLAALYPSSRKEPVKQSA
ncbi:3-hydroxyacyl-CoA dehydrogenase family protein [Flavisolibacter ginsenosidimutans]|uniref:3-hydroxyacyl-CoA dehydrogenase family protein n=1 Tax=Flavisolibacter ginsenosidimutans TaxID=661481 RepID=A0A5B8UCK6_9BACT|nr:3-hydroxyacyl-CoA dehydrogenase family protein [Flavisolibacter ginsenosidimutans]QEC54407.1 3-hydroxyacyl-CoA dehydrogenase family protein [Flavisolibacter ginsenosidimutans]